VTIFDILKTLLHTKSKIDLNLSDEKDFNLFIVNRWLSMYSPQIAVVINETSNRWWSMFKTKQEQYDFLLKLLPRVPFKRTSYIKKAAKTKDKSSEDYEMIKLCAHNREMSVREYLELQKMADC
jgi:hypothetical protein